MKKMNNEKLMKILMKAKEKRQRKIMKQSQRIYLKIKITFNKINM